MNYGLNKFYFSRWCWSGAICCKHKITERREGHHHHERWPHTYHREQTNNAGLPQEREATLRVKGSRQQGKAGEKQEQTPGVRGSCDQWDGQRGRILWHVRPTLSGTSLFHSLKLASFKAKNYIFLFVVHNRL